LVDRSIRIAKNYRTVTCIIIHNDVQELDAIETPPRSHVSVHSGIGHSSTNVVPDEDEFMKAAEILNDGVGVAVIIGSGAESAADEVKSIGEKTGAGVAKA